MSLSSGGSEIVCVVRSLSEQQSDELLLRRLPATSQVLSLATHAVLHRFAGREADWAGYLDDLTDAQATRLAAPPPSGPADPDLLQPSDAPLLTALGLDGRTSYAALAKQAGWTEGRVIRRVEALREAGILYFDVDLASTALGFKAPAYLWLIVEPARLASVGEEISRHAEVPFAAAITDRPTWSPASYAGTPRRCTST